MPSKAPRPGPEALTSHRKGMIATKTRGQIPAGGSERDRTAPLSAARSSATGSPRRSGLRRSPGRASSPCPSTGSDASPGSSSYVLNSVACGGTTLTASGSRRSSLVRVSRGSSSSSASSEAASCLTRISDRLDDLPRGSRPAQARRRPARPRRHPRPRLLRPRGSRRCLPRRSPFCLRRGIVLPGICLARVLRNNASRPRFIPVLGPFSARSRPVLGPFRAPSRPWSARSRAERRGPEEPFGPRRRGAAVGTQLLGSSVRLPPKRSTRDASYLRERSAVKSAGRSARRTRLGRGSRSGPAGPRPVPRRRTDHHLEGREVRVFAGFQLPLLVLLVREPRAADGRDVGWPPRARAAGMDRFSMM